MKEKSKPTNVSWYILGSDMLVSQHRMAGHNLEVCRHKYVSQIRNNFYQIYRYCPDIQCTSMALLKISREHNLHAVMQGMYIHFDYTFMELL